jgi:hypothetical protein
MPAALEEAMKTSFIILCLLGISLSIENDGTYILNIII